MTDIALPETRPPGLVHRVLNFPLTLMLIGGGMLVGALSLA